MHHKSNKKVQFFLSNVLQYNIIPAINKPTRVTRNTAKDIDQIVTNILRSGIQHRSGIMKTGILDHFPIVFSLNTREKNKSDDNAQFIYKSINGEDQTELFKNILSQIEWSSITKIVDNQNTA